MIGDTNEDLIIALSDGFNNLSSSISELNSLAVFGIELVFVIVLVGLAHWKRLPLLYILSSIACILMSLLWIGSGDAHIVTISFIVIALGVVTLFTPIINAFNRR
ncbi:MAG: hypothetical protein FWH42_04210 [Dehalococcoidia bacterium]|nr:hypothetical protein [Dehalococcoidia bacterium]